MVERTRADDSGTMAFGVFLAPSWLSFMRDDDDPLWKEILTHEILWVVVGVVIVLVIAFHLATR